MQTLRKQLETPKPQTIKPPANGTISNPPRTQARDLLRGLDAQGTEKKKHYISGKHAYIHTYLLTYIHTYIVTYMEMYLRRYIYKRMSI